MKQLRRTIRRILLENAQYIEKIVTLVMSCDPINVNSALNLAETMEYINNVQYETDEREEFVRGSFSEKEIVTKHRWEFVPIPEMLDALEQGWKKVGYDRPVFGVGHNRKRDGSYVILIMDKPSDRRPQ